MNVRFPKWMLAGGLALGVVAVGVGGCGDESPTSSQQAVDSAELSNGNNGGGYGNGNHYGRTAEYRATLLGLREVPPVTTNATGKAWFRPNLAGDRIEFMLWVYDVDSLTAAHIHLAKQGEEGPVVVALYTGPTVDEDEWHYQGTITAADLADTLAGMTLDDLINEIEDGNAYVNVHSAEYPEGEIRGQITVYRSSRDDDDDHHRGGVWRPGDRDDHDDHDDDPWGGLPPVRRP